ncbi:oxidoreductase [Blastomyces gilchristii SLH14081]|uniref:Oxidoreductase n=1 Tax=Blastomyces gilchristii (strain SLH14081) TaxID=559298 RepID=A0A179UP82_BLAGS|nr:oxidoreductase [Blastomyces gilchristii SLH14081]OAT08212.1 oxidoreductase [Blastomyces gilchristii SLH14081]
MYWQEDELSRRLSGKVIVITGGTAGVGKEEILKLAQHNPAHIYFTGRNVQAVNSLIDEVNAITTSTTTTNDGKSILTFIPCDQTSLSSVQRTGQKQRRGRIVVTSTPGFRGAPEIGFAGLKKMQGGVGGPAMLAKNTLYSQNKLANVLHAAELARRYPELPVAASHPGVIASTELMGHMNFIDRLVVKLAVRNFESYSLQEGVYNTLWAAMTTTTTQATGTAGQEGASLESGGLCEAVGKPLAHTKLSVDEALAGNGRRRKLNDNLKMQLPQFPKHVSVSLEGGDGDGGLITIYLAGSVSIL